MVATVEKGDADARHLVAGEDAELHGLLRTGVHRRDVLPRDTATGDLVHELVRRRRRPRCGSIAICTLANWPVPPVCFLCV